MDVEDKFILMGQDKIEKVPDFSYLGNIVYYDGDQDYNIDNKKRKAQRAFGKLRKIWKSDIEERLKLRFYSTLVLPILTYGCTSWILSEKVMRSLTAWNARNLHYITNRTYSEETRCPSIDLVSIIKKRRARWLKRSFTDDPSQILTKVLHYQSENRICGDIFMDMPKIPKSDLLNIMKKNDEEWDNIIGNI